MQPERRSGGGGSGRKRPTRALPQPHIEGTLIYVIARCAPGTVVSGDVARRAARGRGHVMAVRGRTAGIRALRRDPGHNTEFPWVRYGQEPGNGEHAQGMLGPEGT